MNKILIKEYIQQILLEEKKSSNENDEEKVKLDFSKLTFGEFISGIRILSKEKENIRKKETQKKYTKAAVKATLMLISAGFSELVNTAVDVTDTVSPLLKQNEKNLDLKGFPEQFGLPKSVTKMLDNKIEDMFAEWLENKFSQMKNEKMPKEFDMLATLNEFLKDKDGLKSKYTINKI